MKERCEHVCCARKQMTNGECDEKMQRSISCSSSANSCSSLQSSYNASALASQFLSLSLCWISIIQLMKHVRTLFFMQTPLQWLQRYGQRLSQRPAIIFAIIISIIIINYYYYSALPFSSHPFLSLTKLLKFPLSTDVVVYGAHWTVSGRLNADVQQALPVANSPQILSVAAVLHNRPRRRLPGDKVSWWSPGSTSCWR